MILKKLDSFPLVCLLTYYASSTSHCPPCIHKSLGWLLLLAGTHLLREGPLQVAPCSPTLLINCVHKGSKCALAGSFCHECSGDDRANMAMGGSHILRSWWTSDSPERERLRKRWQELVLRQTTQRQLRQLSYGRKCGRRHPGEGVISLHRCVPKEPAWYSFPGPPVEELQDSVAVTIHTLTVLSTHFSQAVPKNTWAASLGKGTEVKEEGSQNSRGKSLKA